MSVPGGRAPFAVPGAIDPDAGLRAELAALKAVVYSPDPPTEAVARIADVRAALDGCAAQPVEVPPPAPYRRRRAPLLLAAGVLVAVVGGCLTLRPAAPAPVVAAHTPSAPRDLAAAIHDERAAVQQVVLNHPDELSAGDWFRLYPEDLPRPWSAAVRATTRPGLVGPRSLTLAIRPTTTRLLVFLLCSAPGTPFRWALEVPGDRPAPLGDAAGARCRDVAGATVDVPGGTRAARLRVRIAAGVHYAVTVYEH